MKYEFRYRVISILLKALTGTLSVSGSEMMPKFVCPGDSVQLFQNITFNNCSSVVSLYTNGERNTLIARWSFQNCSRNETLLLDDKEKVFLYGNGTISILNVHPWDHAKYVVISQIGDISVKDVVKINVMTAPANDCRPKILHLGNSLLASLKANVCGKPVATLYWKGYGDVPNTNEPVLKLTPGNQDGIYYACIEGPAVSCAGNSLDYCSKFTMKENISPPILSETWDVKTPIFIVVGIVLGISLILAIAVILIRKRCSKTISRALKGDDVNRGASGDARVKFGENEELEDRKLDPGPLTVLIGSEDHLDNLHDELCIARTQTDQPRPTHDDNLHDELCIARTQTDQPRPTHDDNLSGQQTVPLEKIHEPWSKYFDSLKWEDIKKLLNAEQLQGLKKDCDNLQTGETPVNDDQGYATIQMTRDMRQKRQPLTINPVQTQKQ